MKEQTNMYPWLQWAIACSIVVLIITSATYFAKFGHWLNFKALLPWENAQVIDTLRAINEFGDGTEDLKPYWKARLTSLAGLIVLFVIGPSLWIYSEAKNKRKNLSDAATENEKGWLWYAGVVIVMLGLLYSVSSTIVKATAFENTWESAAKSRNVDELRGELVSLAFDAAEEFYLASGNESKGFAELELKALKSYKSGTANSFVLADDNDSDSTLVIYGVGYKEGPDPDFENVNGEQGKIQLAVQVEPMNGIFKLISTNTNQFF